MKKSRFFCAVIEGVCRDRELDDFYCYDRRQARRLKRNAARGNRVFFKEMLVTNVVIFKTSR